MNNNGYYGVNGVKSLASGLAQFQGTGGFNDTSAPLTAVYRLTDRNHPVCDGQRENAHR